MGKREVSMEGFMELKDAIAYLENALKGLKDGKVVIQKGEEVVELVPEKNVYFSLNAKVKKEKERLSMELFWGKNHEEEESPEKIKISSAL
jgi:amphi-Trp domain-containing protein